ncbi:MAG: SoxR reducing system RseC family protein [Actinobacteria bacterium]|nr:SoxR reducing system RseC family protein [Actinomycetota bacterium]
MKEIGIVVQKSGNRATIKFYENPHCSGCKAGCSAKGKERLIDVDDELGVKVGDTVEVEMEERYLLQGAFLSYMVPLISFFVGYLFGSVINNLFNLKGESLPIALSFTFLFLSYLIIKFLFDKGLLKSSKFEPKLLRKYEV